MAFRPTAVTALVALVAACSQPASHNAAAPANGQIGGAAPIPANAQAVAAAQSPCATATCAGPLLVTAGPMILTPHDRDGMNASATGPVTIANRSNEEVRILLADQDAALVMDNGAQLATDPFGWTGIQGCSGPCASAPADRALTLRPGDSPAQLSIILGSMVPAAQRATLASVTSATLTFTVFAGGRQMQVSVPNVAITNRIPR